MRETQNCEVSESPRPTTQPPTDTSAQMQKTRTYHIAATIKKEDKSNLEQRPESRPAESHDDEFQVYARAVERDIRNERALTVMRLDYINQLREPINQNKLIDMVNLVVLKTEEMIDSDTSILLSAIQDGNLTLVARFLKELKPSRRKELLTKRISSKSGASFLQIALECGKYDIFREMRVNMDKETKRRMALSEDNVGNHLLHDACMENTLMSVQCILANFTRNEREDLIMSTNHQGDSCLRQALKNPDTEVFRYLLTRFTSEENRWRCIRKINKNGTTLAHSLVKQSTRGSCDMLTSLISIAKWIDKINEFLFQPGCKDTLLHAVVMADMNDYEQEENVLTNLTLLLTTADITGCKQRLLWKMQESDGETKIRLTALHRLASIKDINQTRVANHIVCQVDKMQRVLYIMNEERHTGRNALHAAAKSDNVSVMHCLLKYIPSKERMKCLIAKCNKGYTPLHIAASDTNSLDSFKGILSYLNHNERYRIVLSKEAYGNSPILIAFIDGNIPLVNFLVKEEWVPHWMVFPLMCARNNAGWTIIHLACIRLVGDSLTESVLKFLDGFPGVNMRAMINHIDHNGNTALHLSALLFRPASIRAILKYLHKSQHRRLLQHRNVDGLVASQLCNMPDLVVLKYLEPLLSVGWSETAITNKRDGNGLKSETQLVLKRLEEENRITPTPIDPIDEELGPEDLLYYWT